MIDYSTITAKIADLKAKIEQSSITPLYLGSIFDDFIAMMKAIDMTDLHEDIVAAVSRSITALSTAREALANAAKNKAYIEQLDSFVSEQADLLDDTRQTLSSALESIADIRDSSDSNLLYIRDLQGRTDDLEEAVGLLTDIADTSAGHLRPDIDQSEDYVTIGTYGIGPKDDLEWRPVDILPATPERAGVMTAEDKRRLDTIVTHPDTIRALTVEEIIEVMKY